MGEARLVTTPEALEAVAQSVAAASTIAVDVESNGLHAYRPRLCTVQLAWDDEIAIVDAIAVDVGPLAIAFAAEKPTKLLHDLTFDARLLSEHAVRLGHAKDTSVAARMLGRKALGLGGLALSELGLTVSKSLQKHDWTARPIDEAQLTYLATDVTVLAPLADILFAEVTARGLDDEVREETAHKLAEALAPPRAGTPPWSRVIDAHQPPPVLAALRAVWAVREQIAESLDVPPFKIAPHEVLVSMATARPIDHAGLRALPRSREARLGAYADRYLEALAHAPPLSDEELAALRPIVPAREVREERKKREDALRAFRKAEATARAVDEQAVLPGHCLKELALTARHTLDDLRSIHGFGEFRVRRYGEKILSLVG